MSAKIKSSYLFDKNLWSVNTEGTTIKEIKIISFLGILSEESLLILSFCLFILHGDKINFVTIKVN